MQIFVLNMSALTHQVYEDYDCMLNQTNVGHNNNKFYVIQLIKANNKYCLWNRWGRVVSKRFLLQYLVLSCFYIVYVYSMHGPSPNNP